jgi:hypothetical protein
MKSVLFLALAGLLAGCGLTPQGDALRQGIATYGAQAADEGLVNAEWYLCSAAPVGSIKRRYAVSKQKADAYKELCGAGEDADVIGAPEVQ